MKIWVVLHGELSEGGDVLSVHYKEKDALETALKTLGHFGDGTWKWSKNRNCYINGCDFIRIESFEVEGTQE